MKTHFTILMLLIITSHFLPARADAHDFWIEPSVFQADVDERIELSLRVGDHLQGEPVPRIPAVIERFIAIGPGGEEPVIGVDGVDPAGFLRKSEPGYYLIGYRSRPSSVTLEPAKFETYLKEEGLDHLISIKERPVETNAGNVRAEERPIDTVSADRTATLQTSLKQANGPAGNITQSSGKSPQSIREVFSRCAKSLINVGEATTGPFDSPLGFTLEIIPLQDPNEFSAGQELDCLLLFEGRPLVNATVKAVNRGDADHPVSAHTDAEGRVSLPLARPGFWLVKAVHLRPAPPNCSADYESFWASLTFEISEG